MDCRLVTHIGRGKFGIVDCYKCKFHEEVTSSDVNDFVHPLEISNILRPRIKDNCQRLIAIKKIKRSNSSENESEILRILNDKHESSNSKVFRYCDNFLNIECQLNMRNIGSFFADLLTS
mmetsp:Transcript_16522/g.24018  ORF Transcript_16522/g.24018 Transcript_16522/m.24018 type:complete len:120 (+) Transcript_16522:1447-1806(+)